MVTIPYRPVQNVGIAREGPAYNQVDSRKLADAAGAGIGRAISAFGANLGDSLGQLGAVYEQRQEQSSRFDAERRFQEMNGELDRQYLEVRRGAPVNGEGLPEKMSQTFGNIADKGFLESLPPELRQRYAPRVEALRQNYALKSISEKFQLQDKHSQTTLNDRFQEEVKGVLADPSTTEARMKALGALIQESTLPDELKETFAKQAIEGLGIARAKADARTEPEVVAGAVGGLKSALKMRESSNNPKVVNQFGYAGSYQFGAPRLVTMGVYRPGEGENLQSWNKTGRSAPGKWSGTFNIPGFPEVRSLSDFLNNPAAQEKAYDIHDNLMSQEIKRMGFEKYIGQTVRGVPITEQGLKAGMHLGGAGGVQKFFEGKDSADANGTKVAAYMRMGAGVADAPRRYAGVPVDKLERAMNDGLNEKARDTAQAQAQSSAYNKSMFDGLMLAIDRGQAGQTEIAAAREQGWLDDAGTLRAENALDTLNAKTQDLRIAQGKFQAGDDYQWNLHKPDDRKSVNLLSDEAGKFMDSSKRMAYDMDVWSKTGIASDNLMHDVAGGLSSPDIKRIKSAANIAGNMLNANSNAFAGAPNREMIEKAGLKFLEMNRQGYNADEAAKQIAIMNDPVERSKRMPSPNQVTEFQKQLNKADLSGEILSKFNPGFWGQAGSVVTFQGRQPSADEVGLNPGQKAAIEGMYKDLILEHYKDSGDESMAKKYAEMKMQQQFGISNGRLLQFPPEKAPGYPAINGSKDWVYKQAAQELTSVVGSIIKPEDIKLVPTDGRGTSMSTRDAFVAGAPVPYEVLFRTMENGIPRWDWLPMPGTVRGRVWVADYDKWHADNAENALMRGVGAGLDAARDGLSPQPKAIEETRGRSLRQDRGLDPLGSPAGVR